MSKWWSKIIVLHYRDNKLISSNPFRFRYKTGRNFEKILESMSHDNEVVYLKDIKDFIKIEMGKLEPVEFDDLMLYDTLRDLYDIVNGCIEKFNSERKYKE